MSLRIKIIIQILLSFSALSNAQEFERSLNGIPTGDASGIISNTFSGGHNNIEHQFVDIDGDGDLDIIYLDSDKSYGWYTNIGDKFNPNYILSFDTIPGMKFSDWFFLVDIDDDNDLDIFTGGAPALIQFRRNAGSFNNPFFVLEIDTLHDDRDNPIFSEFGCNPVFADMDDDGDYDFISGSSVGKLTYFENIGTNQAFNFKFITDFWQNILIIGGAKSVRHGASSLDFADIDNDNDYDLFWGDFFGRSIYYIQNNGSAITAVMDTPYTYSTFPQNEDSVWTSGFNMPRLADIDGDNDFDLFVTVLYDPTVPQSLMFYRNQGNLNNADFHLENKNFLKTLDVGGKSSPVFVDIDTDRDMDLFMGSEKFTDGSLHFFENTGTIKNPAFLLIDSVYSGIKGELTITPSFGDLDGDGDYDLLIGEFLGRFAYYENTGTSSSPNFQFVEEIRDSSGDFINIGNYGRPFLIDIDNDGDLDLVTGGFNGQIRLYRNTGTVNNYKFTRDFDYFNSLDVGDNSSPFLIDYDNDGDFDLFTGSDSVSIGNIGNIFYYRNDGNNINPVWTLTDSKFLNQTFGGYGIPFFVDINNDTDLDLFIGNVKGGLYYFENKLVSSVKSVKQQPETFSLEAFPNPFNSLVNLSINMNKAEEIRISIYNILGERVRLFYNGVLQSGKNKFTWDGKNDNQNSLPSGNYFVVAKTSDYLKTIKLILLK